MVSPFVKRYLLAVNRYRWAGLASFLAILGASGVVAFQPPPPEQFYTEVILADNAPLVTFTATGPQVQQQGEGIINEDLLLSDILLEQVSAQLAQRGINLTTDQIRLDAQVEVAGGEGEGRRVAVRYFGDNPETTETVVAILFPGMIELSRATNKARLQSIIDALNERLPSIEGELRQAEQGLEAYDRQEGPAIQAALDGTVLGGITGSQQQFQQNLIALAGIDAEMQSLQQQLGLTPEQAYAASALSADPIIANLRAQIYDAETQVTLLANSGYREEHPAVQELLRSLNSFNSLLAARAQEVISGGGQGRAIPSGQQVRRNSSLDPARAALANQLVGLDTQRKSILQQQRVLQQTAQQLTQQYAVLPNKQLERERLAYQVALKRALYDQIQARIVDAEAAEAETVSSLDLVTPPATVSAEPETPNPVVVLLAGGLIGLVVGGGIIFLLDMLDGTIRTPEDLEGLLREQDVPILAAIPPLRMRPAKAAPILIQADTQYQESYERFLSKLRLTGADNGSAIGPRVVLMTSTRENEGKSVNAYNLAISAARAGRRTLLVEADLRTPSKVQYLGLDIDSQAMLEPLRYYGGHLGENVRMVPFVENLYVAASPGPQRQAAGILESSEMRRFLEDAKGRFDMVVLDTPSLSRCDDALLLESQTDGIILVTRPGMTEKAILTTVLEDLDINEDVELLGAIINDADTSFGITGDDDDLDDDELFEDELMKDPEPVPVSTTPIDF
ncbi:MAG: cobalamin biosynthesis protein CobQ [Cyanobacteria bacterium P01_A01_bin.105]